MDMLDQIPPEFRYLPFHLWSTSPQIVDSLYDSACKFLWCQHLIHCGEHTLNYIHKHVNGVPNLREGKFKCVYFGDEEDNKGNNDQSNGDDDQ